MKFKFKGDVYKVHPAVITFIKYIFSIIVLLLCIDIAEAFNVIPLTIAVLIIMFVIAVVFSDGNIQ